MLCDDCKPWAATTTRQLRLRQDSIRKYPEMTGYPCPQCSSTEWLTSAEMIRDPSPPRRLIASENFQMLLGLIAALIIMVAIFTAVSFAPCDGTFWRVLRLWYHLDCPK